MVPVRRPAEPAHNMLYGALSPRRLREAGTIRLMFFAGAETAVEGRLGCTWCGEQGAARGRGYGNERVDDRCVYMLFNCCTALYSDVSCQWTPSFSLSYGNALLMCRFVVDSTHKSYDKHLTRHIKL
jgi:hypothetical protein